MVTYVKISELPVATEAGGADTLEVNQAGLTRQVSIDQIADFLAEILPPLLDMSDYATDEELADAIAAIPDPAWNDITGKPDLDATYVNVTGDTMTGPLVGTSATFSGNVSTKTTLTVYGSGGVNSGILQHDNTHLYLRPLNASANMYFGSGGSNYHVVTSTGHFQPTTTNVSQLGTTALRWSQINGVLGDFSGALTGTTATFTGNIITNGGSVSVDRGGDATFAQVVVRSDPGQTSSLDLQSTATARWSIRKNVAAESGSNVGSDLQITASNDAGGFLSIPLTITRSTGVAAFGATPTFPTQAPGTNNTTGATTAFVAAALAAGASISVGTTPPVSPSANQLWWNTDASVGGGTMYIYYDSFWVPASPPAGAGSVVQTVSYQTGAVATGTTVIPADDTIPQITEGNEYMTLAITPRSATSKLIIEVVAHLANSGASPWVLAALFQDSTANALATGIMTTTANWVCPVGFRHTMVSGTTSATTFRVRGGAHVAGTTTFNGQGGGRVVGGVVASSIVIQEVL